ncbi:MAG: hypothetical protein AABW73_00645 [Nanoarchaeota archaeon]
MTAKKKSGGKESINNANHEQSIAILALILNIIILPGLGSLIAGKIKEGVWQIAIILGGLLLGTMLIISGVGIALGVPIIIIAPTAAWIWGIVTGIKLIRETHKK